MNRPVDPYALPRRAISLLADAKQREGEMQHVLSSGLYHSTSSRLADNELLEDARMDVEHSEVCQALRYLTLCTGGPIRRSYPDHAYAAKHRAEALTINDVTGYYVSEHAMIASVLMCGGQVLVEMGNWVGIRQPGRCTHCKKIMSHSRKTVCGICHRDGRPLPRNGLSGRNVWVSSGLEMHGARAYTPTKFPPDTDVLGPLPA